MSNCSLSIYSVSFCMLRTTRKAATRRRITEEARNAFARGGFSRVSTASIAAAADVSHGGLFVHFPTRDDLVLAVSQELANGLTDTLYAIATRGAGVADVLQAHLASIEEHEPLYVRLVDEQRLLPKSAQDAWMGLQSAISLHMSTAIRDNLGPIDPAMFFNGWVGLVHHYILNRELFAPGASIIASRGQEMVRYYSMLLAGAESY